MDSLNPHQADKSESEPFGYAVAMTEEGLETLKRIPNLAERGIKIVEAAAAPEELWSEEDRRMMEILPLAEKQLDDMIASFKRSAEINKRTTARLDAVHAELRAAAEALRQTLEKSAQRK
jgi:hypothetical protein